jgi:hypothetical protein
MSFLVFQGQMFGVLLIPLITQCSIEATPALLVKPSDVESNVSVDSLRHRTKHHGRERDGPLAAL